MPLYFYALAITNPILKKGGLGSPQLASTGAPLASLIATVIKFLVVIGAILMVLMFIRGALSWITAEGKPDKLEKARNEIIQAVSGMIILASVVAISTLIGTALGFDIFNFSLPAIGESLN